MGSLAGCGGQSTRTVDRSGRLTEVVVSPLFMSKTAARDWLCAPAGAAPAGSAFVHTIQRECLQGVPDPQFGSVVWSTLWVASLPASPAHAWLIAIASLFETIGLLCTTELSGAEGGVSVVLRILVQSGWEDGVNVSNRTLLASKRQG